MEGTLTGSVNGKRVNVPADTLIPIPANAPPALVSSAEEGVIFIAIKNLWQGISGRAVDGAMAGPVYLEGFGPQAQTRNGS